MFSVQGLKKISNKKFKAIIWDESQHYILWSEAKKKKRVFVHQKKERKGKERKGKERRRKEKKRKEKKRKEKKRQY